ncbi:AraC family transcriptional regulator [Arcobacteraceae bacterium]|nr:AraC family transcriptional regulator [Arcobacteraceae bacterium]
MNKQILEQFHSYIKTDGFHKTFLKNVTLFKTTTQIPREPLIYDLCLILVLQGEKIAYLGDQSFKYDNKNYLVVPTTLPFECETYGTTKEEPFICILITIDKKIMYELLNSLTIDKKEIKCDLGLFADSVNEDIEEITLRLLKILHSEKDSEILGNSIIRELFYTILKGENSSFLHKMFLQNNHEAKIARVLKNIHDNYNDKLDIASLAQEEEMSVSSFHTHFKKITSYTPLQYIKNIRLNKAKDFLINQNYNVTDTAFSVGYVSISQFSNDFKNYFGYPPKEAKQSLQKFTLK